MDNSTIATEIWGLNLVFDGHNLWLQSNQSEVSAPCSLSEDHAERIRVELAKAQLWEWNRFEQMKYRAELRYRRYLGSWLVMCVAALSAYLGYPGYVLPVFFLALSVLLWWRAGYEEQRAEREAEAQRSEFRPEWDYIRERLEEVQP